MIFWSGRGYVVALIAFAFLLASEFMTQTYFGDPTYYQRSGWPKLAAFWVAGAWVWWLGIRWKDKGVRTVIDKETRKEFEIGRKDSLFFVPIQFWGPILFALGVVFFFVGE